MSAKGVPIDPNFCSFCKINRAKLMDFTEGTEISSNLFCEIYIFEQDQFARSTSYLLEQGVISWSSGDLQNLLIYKIFLSELHCITLP